MKHIKTALLSLGIILHIQSTHADIYQCKENGTTAFQSKPCHGQQVFERKIEETVKKPNHVPVTIVQPEVQANTPPSTTSQQQPFYLRWFEKIKHFFLNLFKF